MLSTTLRAALACCGTILAMASMDGRAVAAPPVSQWVYRGADGKLESEVSPRGNLLVEPLRSAVGVTSRGVRGGHSPAFQ